MLQKQHALSDTQNTGNRISKLLDFKFLWEGGMPQTTQEERGLAAHLVVTATYNTFSGQL